jgi:hypothetical protein
MQIRQHPLPTELIPKHTWIVLSQPTKQIRAITVEDSEVVDGKHVVKASGYGFKAKVFPVSKVVKTSALNAPRGNNAN